MRITDLRDFTSVQNNDGVVVQNALQAVSDGDDGLAAEVLPDHLLHDLIGVLVDGAGGFCGHIFFGTKSIPSGDLYVRAWV